MRLLAKETISISMYNYKNKRKGDGNAVPLSKEMLIFIADKNAGNPIEQANGECTCHEKQDTNKQEVSYLSNYTLPFNPNGSILDMNHLRKIAEIHTYFADFVAIFLGNLHNGVHNFLLSSRIGLRRSPEKSVVGAQKNARDEGKAEDPTKDPRDPFLLHGKPLQCHKKHILFLFLYRSTKP